MQSYVLVISLLFLLMVAAVFWWVVRHSTADASGAGAGGSVESYRGGLFWG